jgi:hypothetical protein
MDTRLALVITTALILSNAHTSWANEIYISQIGDDLTLSIYQKSQDNYISLTSAGDNNNITVNQGAHADGSVDVDETGGHEAYWSVTGDTNTTLSTQTDTNRGGGGGGPHHLTNVVNGDNNTVTHTQMGKAGHDGFIEVQGDSNTVDLLQRGNGGVQWADILLTGDGHTIDADQRGTMSHTFAVDLTNGGGAYTITSHQNTNNTVTSKSYSLTGTCTNPSGCVLTISQN